MLAQCGFAPYMPLYEFGVNGQTTTDIGNLSTESGSDIAVQPDGKMILTGSRLTQSIRWDRGKTTFWPPFRYGPAYVNIALPSCLPS